MKKKEKQRRGEGDDDDDEKEEGRRIVVGLMGHFNATLHSVKILLTLTDSLPERGNV